jgi:hypothetical protein
MKEIMKEITGFETATAFHVSNCLFFMFSSPNISLQQPIKKIEMLYL